jgi:hypothetical protein
MGGEGKRSRDRHPILALAHPPKWADAWLLFRRRLHCCFVSWKAHFDTKDELVAKLATLYRDLARCPQK